MVEQASSLLTGKMPIPHFIFNCNQLLSLQQVNDCGASPRNHSLGRKSANKKAHPEN